MVKKSYILFLLIGIGGFLFGFFLSRSNDKNTLFTQENTITETRSKFDLLNKSIIDGIGKHYIINFSPLRDKLEKDQKKFDGTVYLYFNYLNNSSWIGINERKEFPGASLIKVPISMATLKAIEEGKLSLDQKYVIQEGDIDSGFGTLYKTGLNKEFTISKLIEIMLTQSDNTARSALYSVFKNIGEEEPLNDIYSALGWELLPSIMGNETEQQKISYNNITVKALSNMFLALYNSTYLSTEHSQFLLEHLSNTDVTGGIPKYIPNDIKIAHKFGILDEKNIFSDCGIVYVPNRDYLLCVGLEGKNKDTSEEFIANISKDVYDYVVNN